MACCKRKCCATALILTGIVLLVLGCVFIPVFPMLIHNEIKSMVPLKDGSATYDNWEKNPVPIHFQVWVWDLKNPNDFRDGAKPEFEEKGPYTYLESRHKVNITWNANSTVSYVEKRFFVFDPDPSLSVGPDTDQFTTINPVMMTIASILQNEPTILKDIAEFLFLWADEMLFMKRSVAEILWGYDEPMAQKALNLLKKHNISVNISDKFGLFSGNNGSDDGVYNIFTGSDDVSHFGIIDKWNGNGSLTYWNTPYCNDINGTDGTIFPPFVDKSDTLYLFSTDICRAIFTKYREDTSLKGIPLWRFQVPDYVFDNVSSNPDNIGFCTPKNNCLPSGLLNIENCKFGAPIIMSQPHFLNADPIRVRGLVDGMHPDPQKHSTVLDVEYNTGAVFNAQKRLQANIITRNYSHISQTSKMKLTYFPILWLDESATLDDKLAGEFKNQLLTPVLLLTILKFALVGIGAVMILGTAIYLLVTRRRDIELVDVTVPDETPILKS